MTSERSEAKGLNENARKWVEALRSGKYRQARGQLRDGDAYCCLGVACDVYRDETGQGEWEDSIFIVRDIPGERDNLELPESVRAWLGLEVRSGRFRQKDPSGPSDHLTNHNDHGESFTEIADLIESQPKGLFR